MAENDAPNPDLLALRVQIDALDRELLEALNRRAKLAQTVGEVKKREGSVVFRPEREPSGLRPGTPYRVADVELASRLSLFLWNSTPDATLRAVGLTPIPPFGTIANDPGSEAGFAFMWHSHNERKITTSNIFPGGMMMMMLVDSREFVIDETN